MPRELVTIQVGQCGNQIGWRFWELALQEHRFANKSGIFDEPHSTFFRNVNDRLEDIPVGSGKEKIRNLRARAILIDTEEGVVNQLLNDRSTAQLFDRDQILADISGAGNNWAHGYIEYGQKYEELIIEKVRQAVSLCDSLQSFLMLHSLGGGTGSGLGSYILEILKDNFPEAYRFTASVFPSEDDHVITSPYNSILALNHLAEYADCVLPIDNQSLIEICNRMTANSKKKEESTDKKAFGTMNNIAAHLLLNLTSSMRFGGTLNIDLNEITMNLVPYPKMHFLLSSLTPLYSLGNTNVQPRSLDQMFTDSFCPEFQLIKSDPKRSTYLACCLMVRGVDVEMSDIRRNIERIKPTLQFAHWNQEGWKVGHCLTPSLGQKNSLLCLTNNCCIKDTFKLMHARFHKLYSKKAMLHHYTNYIEEAMLTNSSDQVRHLIEEYSSIDKGASSSSSAKLTTSVSEHKRLIPI